MHRFILPAFSPGLLPTLSKQLYLVDSEQALEEAFAIRRNVFIQEQAVSEAEEIDGLDTLCHHLLYRPLQKLTESVGTARLRVVTDEAGVRWGKLERIAVLSAWRGQGIGAQLVKGLIDLGEQGLQLSHFKLGAQCDVIPFYEKLGFTAYGDIFMDARIPHRMMKKYSTQDVD